VQFYLEIFFTKIIEEEVLYYKYIENVSQINDDPDNLVTKYLISTFPDISDNYIVHSTSWRYDNKGKIILTYVVYSDDLDFQTLKTQHINIHHLKNSEATNLKKPRPIELNEKDVISHGMRHFSFLIRKDKKNKFKKILLKNTYKIFHQLDEEISGAIG
jgi:hypothetical protein